MAATLSQEKAAVKPRTNAKPTQSKRLQSLLHISCSGALIRIQPNGKKIFLWSRKLGASPGDSLNVASLKRGALLAPFVMHKIWAVSADDFPKQGSEILHFAQNDTKRPAAKALAYNPVQRFNNLTWQSQFRLCHFRFPIIFHADATVCLSRPRRARGPG